MSDETIAAPGADAADAGEPPPRFSFSTSEGFGPWLAAQEISLAITSKSVHKLFVVGSAAENNATIFERTVPGCLGIGAEPGRIYCSSLYQLWRFENALEPGQAAGDYAAVYLPQLAYTTGYTDIHDVAIDRMNRPVFVSALFSCLGTTTEEASFSPLWHPPFVTALAPENRCFLNGLALADGRPRFVTTAARTDTADGWRDNMRG